TLQEANWNRSSSCWDMSRFKQPSDTLAASSGFGRRSMIVSESNQIPESRGFGRVADNQATNQESRHAALRDPTPRSGVALGSRRNVARHETPLARPRRQCEELQNNYNVR